MAKPLKKHFNNVIGTTVAWIVVIGLFAIVRLYGVEEEETFQLKDPDSYNAVVKRIWVLSLGVGATFGIIFGILDTFKSTIRRASYWIIISIRTIIHIVITLLVIPAYILFIHWIDGDLQKNELTDLIWESPYQKTALVLIIYTGMATMVFNLIRQMNAMYGPGILINILLGKYHRPKEEERVFMFLDLRSSTTYAERLGHVLYSELIQDCFYDLTDTIDKHDVEVYQYVGDEAVLTWKIDEGLKNANCIHAFYTFEETIQSRASYYFNKYDLVPVFKAGINLGLVMVAEVGVIKKEIAYHSDVLNTAARIQGKCNEFGKKILISEALKDRLGELEDMTIESVGTVSLKGKEEKITMFSVDKTTTVEHPFEFSE